MAGKFVICLVAAFALIEPFNTLPAPEPAPEPQFYNAEGTLCNRDGVPLSPYQLGQYQLGQYPFGPYPFRPEQNVVVVRNVQPTTPATTTTTFRASSPDTSVTSYGWPYWPYRQSVYPIPLRQLPQAPTQVLVPSPISTQRQASESATDSAYNSRTRYVSDGNQVYVVQYKAVPTTTPRPYVVECCECFVVQSGCKQCGGCPY